MAIKGFFFIVLTLALISYFVPVDDNSNKKDEKEIPLLIFKDSTMYTLTPEHMNRIIYSKEVLRFKTRDVMYEGALTLKGNDKEGNDITDTLYSDLIVKRGEELKFLNNVKFKRNDYITLNTDELLYNTQTKIATNTLPFEGTYFDNYIKGKDIYLDLNAYYMKAKDTHFEVDIQQNQKGKE